MNRYWHNKLFPGVHFFLNRTNIAIRVIRENKKQFFCEIGNFALILHSETVDGAQPVRASDGGSEGRGFEPHLPPEGS